MKRVVLASSSVGRVEVCSCCGSAYVFLGPMAVRMGVGDLRDMARLLVEAACRASLTASSSGETP